MNMQVIEVSIGLIAAFFLTSIIASAIVEIGSMIFKKRSKDLTIVLDKMLSDNDSSGTVLDLKGTSIYKSMEIASRRKHGKRKDKDKRRPSYMSARSFADGVIEGIVTAKGTATNIDAAIASLADGPLKTRLGTLRAEVGDDLVAIKAGLEKWFDDIMDRLEGAYKRWSQWILLLLGLGIAFGMNISAVRIVDSLWNDATVRTAVVDSASELTSGACPGEKADCAPSERIEQAIADLDGLSLPIGWGSGWSSESGIPLTLLGMLFTGAAVVLGAQFWFDLLMRLSGARNGRGSPAKASGEPGSATMTLSGGSTGTVRTVSSLLQ